MRIFRGYRVSWDEQQNGIIVDGEVCVRSLLARRDCFPLAIGAGRESRELAEQVWGELNRPHC